MWGSGEVGDMLLPGSSPSVLILLHTRGQWNCWLRPLNRVGWYLYVSENHAHDLFDGTDSSEIGRRPSKATIGHPRGPITTPGIANASLVTRAYSQIHPMTNFKMSLHESGIKKWTLRYDSCQFRGHDTTLVNIHPHLCTLISKICYNGSPTYADYICAHGANTRWRWSHRAPPVMNRGWMIGSWTGAGGSKKKRNNTASTRWHRSQRQQ